MTRYRSIKLRQALERIHNGTFVPSIKTERFGPIDPNICVNSIDKGRRLWKRSAWKTSPVIYGREEVLASYERSRLLGVFAHAYRI